MKVLAKLSYETPSWEAVSIIPNGMLCFSGLGETIIEGSDSDILWEELNPLELSSPLEIPQIL